MMSDLVGKITCTVVYRCYMWVYNKAITKSYFYTCPFFLGEQFMGNNSLC